MAEILVNLEEKSYEIIIEKGAIKDNYFLFNKINDFANKKIIDKKVLIITDDNVRFLYADKLLEQLSAANYKCDIFSVKPSESSKSLRTIEDIYTRAIELGLDRKSLIIACGGGVVGDISGFAAATYLRGINFIQIPTTLLAQVDSSIGGKTGVNHSLGKNLIGAFHQPLQVIIDPSVLQTLPQRELLSGLAEVVKYGIFADVELFDFLNDNAADILAKDLTKLEKIIEISCRIKAEIVAKDERESNVRMVLNLGHTIGHAIEALGNYSHYTHGEAIAIGLKGVAMLSYISGRCSFETVEKIEKLLLKLNLPSKIDFLVSVDEVYEYILRDKKAVNDKINWVLINDIGKYEITSVVSPLDISKAISYLSK